MDYEPSLKDITVEFIIWVRETIPYMCNGNSIMAKNGNKTGIFSGLSVHDGDWKWPPEECLRRFIGTDLIYPFTSFGGRRLYDLLIEFRDDQQIDYSDISI